mgnify:CR=1 FL=1
MWNCIDLKRKIQKLVSLSTPLSVHGQDGDSLKHITGETSFLNNKTTDSQTVVFIHQNVKCLMQ